MTWRLAKDPESDVLHWQRRTRDDWEVTGDYWETFLTLDRVWAANLAIELDHWLTGTDKLPTL